jgi:transcription elongation factor Elf1
MIEHFFQCPYCWEQISVLLDSSVKEASFIEDCEVCCNPLEFNVKFNNQELIAFKVNQFQ